MSLAEHSVMVNERADHLPVVLFTKEIMDVDKPVPVVILPPVRFIYRQTSKVTKGIIQGVWDPDGGGTSG